MPSMISPTYSTSSISTSSLPTPRSSTDYFERFLQKQDIDFFCSQKSVVRINSRGHRKKASEQSNYDLNTMIEELIEEINSTCAACRKPIVFGIIKKNKMCYHQSCYCCTLCRIPLSLETSFEFENGKIYCQKDYQVMKSRSNITPLEKTCYKCRMTLENADYKTFKNRMYCKSDFEDLFCRGCSKSVDDKVISATDGKLKGKWHFDCFNCQTCRQPFPDNRFYVFNDLPYCKRHYHKMNNTLCTRCYNPIEGQCAYIPGQGWRFHPNCFRCDACQKKLDDTYHLLGGRIYCDSHIERQNSNSF
ncbi:hypothetical protein INT48_008536 [Thamnidium elegans]|uniref:LIM zinc-binding domain-containing protein n=1 Tax=Thamnidium elegans TaxID=101142 RepID=A0A8H7SSR2_9FUNG|nr:hypothetical protein INT48_008536 [Thamnidium elegans]